MPAFGCALSLLDKDLGLERLGPIRRLKDDLLGVMNALMIKKQQQKNSKQILSCLGFLLQSNMIKISDFFFPQCGYFFYLNRWKFTAFTCDSRNASKQTC